MTKMILNIDLDSMFNTIENADWYTERYNVTLKKEPKGYEARRKWEYDCHYYYKESCRADEGVYGIVEIFNMHHDTQRRMRIAARAKRKWEQKTHYERLLTNKMKEQFANFIFNDNDNSEADGFVVEKRWFFDDSYIRKEIK